MLLRYILLFIYILLDDLAGVIFFLALEDLLSNIHVKKYM